jgi:hypothetical protein
METAGYIIVGASASPAYPVADVMIQVHPSFLAVLSSVSIASQVRAQPSERGP